MIELNLETFKEKIFDFGDGGDVEWKYEGDTPAIIDFHAEWCGPCKTIAPILEEVEKEYDGKVDVYKVNVDENQELSVMFGIQSIPALLFIPTGDELPQMSMGAIPKDVFEKAISEVLNVEK